MVRLQEKLFFSEDQCVYRWCVLPFQQGRNEWDITGRIKLVPGDNRVFLKDEVCITQATASIGAKSCEVNAILGTHTVKMDETQSSFEDFAVLRSPLWALLPLRSLLALADSIQFA